MTYVEKLEAWYQAKKAAGEIVDLKLFPMGDELDADPERSAKAVFEIVTGQRESRELDLKELDGKVDVNP